MARLVAQYGPLPPPRRFDPLTELVLTVLSQNTSDRNSHPAFEALRSRFASWEEMAGASEDETGPGVPESPAHGGGPRVAPLPAGGRPQDGGGGAPLLPGEARPARGHPCPPGSHPAGPSPPRHQPGEGPRAPGGPCPPGWFLSLSPLPTGAWEKDMPGKKTPLSPLPGE